MQQQATSASRNQHMNSGAMPGKVSTPQGKAPTPDQQATGVGHKPGSSVQGFAGGLKPGKV